MKKIILLIIISTTFVFGQAKGLTIEEGSPLEILKPWEAPFPMTALDEVSPFSTSSNYKFELNKKGKEGEITFSSLRTRHFPSRFVYVFTDKVKPKNIKSSSLSIWSPDFVEVVEENANGREYSIRYNYRFDVFSNYDNGQFKEKGGVEYRERQLMGFKLYIDPEPKGYILKDGKWQGWYDSGELRYSATHVSGQLHGQVDVYFKNGQKKSGGEYSYNRKVGKHAEWYKSGWIKEYSVDGAVKRSHKESEQAFFWNSENDKNYQAAYALANELYSEISNPSKELELESKSNPLPLKRIYETFAFTGEYKRYADSWYVGQFITSISSTTVAISISSRYKASVFLDYSTGWMSGSLSYDGSSSLGDRYVWRHENAKNDELDIIFYFNDSERAIYTGGGYRMSRQTSRSVNVYKVEYKFNCKDGKCTKD